jgi:Arc/MetJ family transcription regulator
MAGGGGRNDRLENIQIELANGTFWVQIGAVKTSVDLDDELQADVAKMVELVREKPATVLRLAIRAGLPLVASRFQSPRPEGYFADAYPLPQERLKLENAMSKQTQRPER